MGPVTWTSLPSLPGETRSDETDTTAPDPSSRLRAVLIARPSFQNRMGNEATNRTSPTSTLLIDSARRENHDLLVVTVKRSDMMAPYGRAQAPGETAVSRR